jgi:O-antigen/teichoic acid export membrane protein
MIAFLIMLESARKRDRCCGRSYNANFEIHNEEHNRAMQLMTEKKLPDRTPASAGAAAGMGKIGNDDAIVGADANDHGLKRILKNTAWLLAGKGFGGALSLVYLAILTRTLGLAGWGQFAIITGTATALVTFISFQTWQVIVRYGATHLAPIGERAEFVRLIGLCAAFDFLGAVAGCLLIGVLATFLAPYFGWDAQLTLTATMFSMTMLMALKSTPTGILRVLNRFDLGTYAEAVIPLVRLIGVLAAWVFAPRLAYFLLAWAAAEVVHSIVYWTMALQQVGKFSARNFFRFGTAMQENAGIGGFLLVTNAGSTLSGFAKNSAVLFVGFFAGAAAAGLFRLASQISTAMTKISTLLSRAIFAEVNQVRAQHGDDALRAVFKQTARFLFAASFILIGLVAVLGKPILLLMSGAPFLAAYPLLFILAAAACLDLAGAIYEPILLSGGAARSTLWLNAISAIAFIAVLALLLPPFGSSGAAWAVLIASFLRLVIFGAAAQRHLRRV